MADDIYVQIGSNLSAFQRDLANLRKNLNGLNGTLSSGSQQAAKNFSTLGTKILDVNKAAERSRGAIDLTPLVVSAKKATEQTERLRQSVSGLTSPALRYALYDVGSSFRNLALAFAAVPVATTALAIKYERDFANVIRTNDIAGESMKALRESLLADLRGIQQATPISWEEVTQIAALAGQLGIAKESTADFTETVAKFASTTDLTVQAAATAFGRLDQLIDGVDGQFNKLGSAILAVGVDSVATESQIVGVATQIASMGNLANLSAADIVGLSGSLASLGIAPELARGTVTRLFSEIGASVAEGGYSLNEFARVTGRSAQEFTEAWSSQPTEVLLDFFEGIQREGNNAERTLREIGITSVRDIPAILRLAQSQDEVRRLIALSNEEFALGLKVNEQYSIISGTTAEQLKRLGQNLEALGASFGSLINPVSAVVGVINAAVESLTNFINTPVGQVIAGIAVSVSLLLAALFGIVAAAVVALAGLIALRFAVINLGAELAGLTLKTLFSKKAFEIFGITALTTSKTVIALSRAVKILSLSLGIIGAALIAIGFAYEAYTKKTEAVKDAQEQLFGNQELLSAALEKDKKVYNETGKALNTFVGEIDKVENAERELIRASLDYVSGQEDVEDSTFKGIRAMERQAEAAKALGEELVVLGDNFALYLTQQAAQSPGLLTAFENVNLQEAFAAQGFGDFQSFIDLAIGSPDEARKKVAEIKEALRTELQSIDTRAPGGSASAKVIRDTLASLAVAEAPLEAIFSSIEDGSGIITDAARSTEYLSGGFEELEYKADIAEGKIEKLLDTIFGEANAAKDATDATQEFFASLASGEGTTERTDEGLQKMIGALAGNEFRDVAGRIADLSYVLQILEAEGLGATGAAIAARLAIVELGGAAGVEGVNVQNFTSKLAGLISGVSILGGLTGAVESGLNGIDFSAGGASGSVETLADKFSDLVDSMFESINLGRDTEDAIFALGEAFGESGDEALYASDEMQDAIGSILKGSDSAEQGVANLAALFAHLAKTAGGESAPSLQILRQAISQVGAQFGLSTAQVQQFINTAGGGLANINLNNFNLGVQNAQKEVRTLLDYASDLESVFTRAFDIRFARGQALDDIAESFQNLSEQVEDARFELEELQASQSDLGADRGLKEYFLSIAEAYGDTLRAAQLRKEIADLDREQAENSRRLEEAQAIAGGDLTGQGPGQRENRQALLGLVQDYQSYITALAESGATQAELKAATEEARQQFIQQATELGFQETVVLEYAKAFDDVQTAISKVERNITVEANVNPALQALNELNASLKKNIEAARTLNSELGTKKTTTTTTTTTTGTGTNLGFGNRPRPSRELNQFSIGGFTGQGGRNQPAGIVHKGEYVIPKQFVNQSSGMPDPSFLAQMQNGMRSYQMGGFVGGGAMGSDGTVMVELSPFDRKLLADAGNVQLRLNGRVVAEATNQNNFDEARRGSN